jgi:hypothetical protein
MRPRSWRSWALGGQVAPVYLADAVVELGFIALLMETSNVTMPGAGA